MKATGRRGFLKMMGLAPVAGPQAAAEVAASMGLSNGVAAAGAAVYGHGDGGYPVAMDDRSWLRKSWDELVSGKKKSRAAEHAKETTLILDPDIASLRSVSPGWKRMRQIERHVDRAVARERSSLFDRARELGIPLS